MNQPSTYLLVHAPSTAAFFIPAIPGSLPPPHLVGRFPLSTDLKRKCVQGATLPHPSYLRLPALSTLHLPINTPPSTYLYLPNLTYLFARLGGSACVSLAVRQCREVLFVPTYIASLPFLALHGFTAPGSLLELILVSNHPRKWGSSLGF